MPDGLFLLKNTINNNVISRLLQVMTDDCQKCTVSWNQNFSLNLPLPNTYELFSYSYSICQCKVVRSVVDAVSHDETQVTK